MTSIGQRGKYAEKKVREVLEAFNDHHFDVAYHRYPDARSARGALSEQPADFLVAAKGKSYHLEVKELEHDYRLPKDKVKQLPRLRKFKYAGMDFAVLTYHTELKKWRCVPSVFFNGDIPASWDLQRFELFPDAEAALRATGWF